MYRALYGLIALGAVGLARRPAWRPGIAVLAGFFAMFWAGQLYHVVVMFMAWGIATTLGAYLCAITTAEVGLCVAGLRGLVGRWAIPLGVVVFAALDVYSLNFVALPYYAGMTVHRATRVPGDVSLGVGGGGRDARAVGGVQGAGVGGVGGDVGGMGGRGDGAGGDGRASGLIFTAETLRRRENRLGFVFLRASASLR